MIWYFLLIAVVSTIQGFFGLLSLSRVTTLPWGIDSFLVTAFGQIHSFIAIFPPIGVALNAFVIYLSFEILMFFLKTFRIVR